MNFLLTTLWTLCFSQEQFNTQYTLKAYLDSLQTHNQKSKNTEKSIQDFCFDSLQQISLGKQRLYSQIILTKHSISKIEPELDTIRQRKMTLQTRMDQIRNFIPTQISSSETQIQQDEQKKLTPSASQLLKNLKKGLSQQKEQTVKLFNTVKKEYDLTTPSIIAKESEIHSLKKNIEGLEQEIYKKETIEVGFSEWCEFHKEFIQEAQEFVDDQESKIRDLGQTFVNLDSEIHEYRLNKLQS